VIEISLLEVSRIHGSYTGSSFCSKGGARSKGTLGRGITGNSGVVSGTEFMFARLGLRIRGPPIRFRSGGPLAPCGRRSRFPVGYQDP